MNLEPIRALLESAKAAAVKPTFGDHPDALAYAEMRTTEFAKAAIPALSQLLEAVTWIKCSERMPAPSVRIQFIFQKCFCVGFLNNDGDFMDELDGDENGMPNVRFGVTHWMPLPSPPEDK